MIQNDDALIRHKAKIDYNIIHLTPQLLEELLSNKYSKVEEFVYKTSLPPSYTEDDKVKALGHMLLYSIDYHKDELAKYFIDKGADFNSDSYYISMYNRNKIDKIENNKEENCNHYRYYNKPHIVRITPINFSHYKKQFRNYKIFN